MAAITLSQLVSAALVAALAAGQTVAPTNETFSTSTGLQLSLTNPPNPPTPSAFNVVPITGNAGQNQETGSITVRRSENMSRVQP
jgi:hypothetical protein